MAVAGSGIIAASPIPPLLDRSNDTRISVNVRQGLLTFAAGTPYPSADGTIDAGGRTAGTRTTALAARSGIVPFTHYDVWYKNTILHPQITDAGTIVSNYEFDLLIWNSDFITKTFVIAKSGWDGVEDAIPAALTLNALCWRSYRVVVTMDGPSNVDAAVSFTSGGMTATATIKGLRGVVWGFRPNRNFKEIWEWKTEIQSAWDYTEQRLALRDVPRLTCEFAYTLADAEATQADLMLYNMSQYSFTLPRWEQQVPATVHAGDEAVVCDVSRANWQVGSVGLVWKSPRLCELFTVTQVGENSLRPSVPVVQEFGKALVMPCTGARITGSMSRSDGQLDRSDFSLSFLLNEPPDWPVPDSTDQLDGHDVWELPLFVTDTLSRSLECPAVTLDNGLGVIRTFHAQPVSTGNWQITALADGLTEINTLRRLLLRRQGCVRPFWMSTRRHDFTPAATLRAGSDTLLVKGCAMGMGFPARSLRKRLRIEMADGTVLYRGILGLVKEDTQTDNLRLSEALDAENDLVPADFARISFLTLVRLASDNVEWTWLRSDRAEVTFPVQEVLV